MNLMGNKICLRNIENNDKETLKELINDEEISKSVVGWSKPISATEHTIWFDNLKDDNSFRYIISSKIDKTKTYGTAIISKIDWKNRSCSIDIKLLMKFQGNGYGSEAIELLKQYIFEELNMNRIFLNILEYNTKSIKLFEKMGFIQEGIKRKAIFKNGKYNDLIVYSLLKEEYVNERNR